MSPDPLKEQLETLLADESAAITPTKVSPGIERIVKALQDQAGIQDVSLGRQVCKIANRSYNGGLQTHLWHLDHQDTHGKDVQ